MFAGLDDPVNRTDLKAIAKLKIGSETRRNRVERYVNSVQSPRIQAFPPPMAFAAMMMGLPPTFDPEDSSLLDEMPDDPDLMELRDEKRPKMKERFLGWWSVGRDIKGGKPILEKIWREVDGKGTGSLSCVGFKDVVDEMVERLIILAKSFHTILLIFFCRISDYPSKHHIRDALLVLASFYKSHKRAAPKRSAPTNTSAASPSLRPPVIPSTPSSSGSFAEIDNVD